MNERLRDGLHQALFGWLNLALTAPSVYLWLGLPLIMRQHGWSGVDIGLFQLAGVPAVFKFLLAAPVERYRLGGARTGRYQAWAVLLCMAFALVLCLVGRQELLSSRAELFGLALLAALLATWADIPVNALAIKLLPASQRLRAGGIRSAALSMGAIVGGGLMLLVQARWGWRAPFWLMAGGLVAGAIGLCLVHEPAASPVGTSLSAPEGLRLRDFRDYLAQPAARPWTALLLLYFPFIGAAWFYLKPLLLDHGFAMRDVALVVGVGGGLVAAVASLLAARLIRSAGLSRAVPACAGLSFAALAALTLAVALQAGPAMLICAALLVAVAMGSAATLAFGLMMHFTRRAREAVDYGTQASLFSLSRLAVPLLAGLLLDRTGAVGMLLFLSAAMAGVVVLSLRSRHRIAEAVWEGRA